MTLLTVPYSLSEIVFVVPVIIPELRKRRRKRVRVDFAERP